MSYDLFQKLKNSAYKMYVKNVNDSINIYFNIYSIDNFNVYVL